SIDNPTQEHMENFVDINRLNEFPKKLQATDNTEFKKLVKNIYWRRLWFGVEEKVNGRRASCCFSER
ncbi:11372_t:CDS:1, partial [Paraglomus occultum]